MRTTIAALAVLLTALLTGPVPTASAAPATDRTDRTDRIATTQQAAMATLKERVIALTNAKRVDRGCNRVRSNAALGRAAQKHSRRMANAEDLDHRLPGEPGLRARYRIEGYIASWWGENIAFNQRTARQVFRAWWTSSTHRRNILNCRFKHIGIGFARDDDGQPYWTQDFGRR